MSNGIRKLPAQDERVETGPVQFGDDWPGVFFRGDDAADFRVAIDEVNDLIFRVASEVGAPCGVTLSCGR